MQLIVLRVLCGTSHVMQVHVTVASIFSLADSLQLKPSSLPPLQHHLVVTAWVNPTLPAWAMSLGVLGKKRSFNFKLALTSLNLRLRITEPRKMRCKPLKKGLPPLESPSEPLF